MVPYYDDVCSVLLVQHELGQKMETVPVWNYRDHKSEKLWQGRPPADSNDCAERLLPPPPPSSFSSWRAIDLVFVPCVIYLSRVDNGECMLQLNSIKGLWFHVQSITSEQKKVLHSALAQLKLFRQSESLRPLSPTILSFSHILFKRNLFFCCSSPRRRNFKLR